MMQLRKKFSRQLAWFFAGLLCTFLFSVVSSSSQPAIAGGDGNAVNFLETQSSTFLPPSFEEVAASHLEPNFYE